MTENLEQTPRRRIVERIWPLPPVAKRHDGIIPLKTIFPLFSLNKDGEYLCYVLVKTSILFGATALALLVVDMTFHLGLVIDPSAVDNNKLALTHAYAQMTVWPFIIIGTLKNV